MHRFELELHRFQFRFSIVALIALIHDLLICTTIYLLLNFEITPSTIIALLTILGYSLYDTVILFDKLRDSQRMNKESNLSIKTLEVFLGKKSELEKNLGFAPIAHKSLKATDKALNASCSGVKNLRSK